jgi:hypothetical protein
MYEFMGSSGENFYTRVYDSHIVEYIPIPIEITDVTDQFQKIKKPYEE